MTRAFPDFPNLSGIQSQRPFSLPQQNYLLAQFLLEQCKDEAQRWLEGDYPVEELKRMSRRETMERLDAYQYQLGQEEAFDAYIEARSQLIEWGFEQLHQWPQLPPIVAILAKRNLIDEPSRLQERFVEICMRLIPKEALNPSKGCALIGDD